MEAPAEPNVPIPAMIENADAPTHAVTQPEPTATGSAGYSAQSIAIFVLGSIGLLWFLSLFGFLAMPMLMFQGIGIIVTGVIGLVLMFVLANYSINGNDIAWNSMVFGNVVGGLISLAVVITAIRMGVHSGRIHAYHFKHHHHHKTMSKPKHHSHHHKGKRMRY